MQPASEDDAETTYARVANRLAELIQGVKSVRLDVDERRELLTLMLTERDGTEYEARSLSDGTLRFLALAVLEGDSEVRGVLCMEEPENGIHPQRIPAMLRLLRDLSVDSTIPVDEDNTLRQVIVNTHRTRSTISALTPSYESAGEIDVFLPTTTGTGEAYVYVTAGAVLTNLQAVTINP